MERKGVIDIMLTSSTEEKQECAICEKPIDEDKDDYEIIETFLEGNHEDMCYLHTNCRYDHDKKKEKALDKIETIQVYVRMLQDGDPENENPKKILDYIEKEVDDVIVQESGN